MNVSEFLAQIENKLPPAPEAEIAQLESSLSARLPTDYRSFLSACNGGYVGGALWFDGPTPDGSTADAGVHHVGGFRDEEYFSLIWANDNYQGRIPSDLLWIADDPFGNAICLGLRGDHSGQIFFWDHEMEPEEDAWDGSVETAGNVTLLANSFDEFVAGLRPADDETEHEKAN